MRKADLINAIHDAMKLAETPISKTQVEGVLDTFSTVTKDALKNESEITLPGFGKFSTSKRAARTGRNPQTGEPLDIAAATVAKFSPAKGLKDALN